MRSRYCQGGADRPEKCCKIEKFIEDLFWPRVDTDWFILVGFGSQARKRGVIRNFWSQQVDELNGKRSATK